MSKRVRPHTLYTQSSGIGRSKRILAAIEQQNSELSRVDKGKKAPSFAVGRLGVNLKKNTPDIQMEVELQKEDGHTIESNNEINGKFSTCSSALILLLFVLFSLHLYILGTINELGNKRGHTKCLKVWKDADVKKISVDMNELYQPIGDNQNKLKSFCSTIARNSELCPLNFVDWRKMPREKKQKMKDFVAVSTELDTFKV